MTAESGRSAGGGLALSRLAQAAAKAVLSLTVLALGSGCAPEADPDADCGARSFHWSESEPQINLRHIFCGELDDGRAKGLHAADLMAQSPAVVGISDRREEGRGIYTAIVRFADGQTKLSTFFPDACTWREIQSSVFFAATHPLRDHRQWGQIGLSAPASGADGYCLDARGQPFEVRFAVRRDGRINTAFPN